VQRLLGQYCVECQVRLGPFIDEPCLLRHQSDKFFLCQAAPAESRVDSLLIHFCQFILLLAFLLLCHIPRIVIAGREAGPYEIGSASDKTLETTFMTVVFPILNYTTTILLQTRLRHAGLLITLKHAELGHQCRVLSIGVFTTHHGLEAFDGTLAVLSYPRCRRGVGSSRIRCRCLFTLVDIWEVVE